jgi:hypothetical protein
MFLGPDSSGSPIVPHRCRNKRQRRGPHGQAPQVNYGGGRARDSSAMSPRVPRTRYSNSSGMPSEQCAEESVRRDVHCITISPGNAGRTCTVPHESRRLVGVHGWWYWQSDLAKLLESKPTSQQQLMSVQQKSLPHPHGCHRVSPQAPALKPRVFPPPQNASWPVSPHPSWDFGDQSLCRRLLLVRQNAQHGTEKSKQRIMLAQTTGKLQPLQHARRVHGPAFGSCCGPGERPQIPGAAISRD